MPINVLPDSLEGIPMTFELVRDRIAEILTAELANQVILAADPTLFQIGVVVERSNPWDTETLPVINVWYDTGDILTGQSPTSSNQQGDHFYNIDCYAQKDTTLVAEGDTLAAKEAQRIGRVVYQIIMADLNNNLQFPLRPSIIGHRIFRQLATIQPVFGDHPIEHISAMRLRLEVRHNETPPVINGELLEGYDYVIRRKDTTLDADIPVEVDY